MINFTTGPVSILPGVRNALCQPELSHRSPAFRELLFRITEDIIAATSVHEVYILPGSGTLANEMMLVQIARSGGDGLIVSNGEFGERLVQQANRSGLHFEVLAEQWGNSVNVLDIKKALLRKKIKWILLCHCESSSGIINPLYEIAELAKGHGCEVYVDCMTTFGTTELCLANIAMATASSGKGIGAIAGLSIIFCNKEILRADNCPLYLDLHFAKSNGGIPFTLSSNLLLALYEGIQSNLNKSRWSQLDEFSEIIYDQLHPLNIIPFGTAQSRIFTVDLKDISAVDFAANCFSKGFLFSYQSSYLVKRNWLQLALLGNFVYHDILNMLSVFKDVYSGFKTARAAE